MDYLVILNSNKDLVQYTLINGLNFERKSLILTDTKANVVKYIFQSGARPLNFSIDRRNSIKEDSGSFNRFSSEGTFVVIGEIQSNTGRILGYRLLNNLNGSITNMRTADIVYLEKEKGRPVLQNGIVRGNTVYCYPLHKFPIIKLNKTCKKPKATKPARVSEVKRVVSFTPQQLKELELARNNGINTKFIENTNLSPEQMRVCWVAKKNGILSEYFASPEFSVEVMKFYADRLVNKKIVDECALMLNNPKLPLDSLVELYLCICDGVDYSKVINKNASEIEIYRAKESVFDNFIEYKEDKSFDNALNVAIKLRGCI